MRVSIATEVKEILAAGEEGAVKRENLLRLRRLMKDLRDKGILHEDIPSFPTIQEIGRYNYDRFIRNRSR